MPRRPAQITQADVTRVIRAAKKAGAAEVEVRVSGQSLIVRLAPSTTSRSPLNRPRISFCDGRYAPPSSAASTPAGYAP